MFLNFFQKVLHTLLTSPVKISNNSRFILSASYDNNIRFFDLETKDNSILINHDYAIYDITISLNNILAIYGTHDKMVGCLNMENK